MTGDGPLFAAEETAPVCRPGPDPLFAAKRGLYPFPCLLPAPPHQNLTPMCYAKLLKRRGFGPLPPTGTECI